MSIFNKKANFTYSLEAERVEAGISLTGAEAKAVRTGHADLSDSHAKIISGEIFLVNAKIYPQNVKGADTTRRRKLLLHKSEIVSLGTKMKQKKLTLVPIKLYTKGPLVKLELGLGKPKRKFEKREALKKKDLKRELAREIKSR